MLLAPGVDSRGRRVTALAQRPRDGGVLLEFEVGSLDFHAAGRLQARVQADLEQLGQASRLPALCTLAAAQVRALTGFNRVMIYRFTEAWDGTVTRPGRRRDPAVLSRPALSRLRHPRPGARTLPHEPGAYHSRRRIRPRAPSSPPAGSTPRRLSTSAPRCCVASPRCMWSTCTTWAPSRPCRCPSWWRAGCGDLSRATTPRRGWCRCRCATPATSSPRSWPCRSAPWSAPPRRSGACSSSPSRRICSPAWRGSGASPAAWR